jgi:hypothetical protein
MPAVPDRRERLGALPTPSVRLSGLATARGRRAARRRLRRFEECAVCALRRCVARGGTPDFSRPLVGRSEGRRLVPRSGTSAIGRRRGASPPARGASGRGRPRIPALAPCGTRWALRRKGVERLCLKPRWRPASRRRATRSRSRERGSFDERLPRLELTTGSLREARVARSGSERRQSPDDGPAPLQGWRRRSMNPPEVRRQTGMAGCRPKENARRCWRLL